MPTIIRPNNILTPHINREIFEIPRGSIVSDLKRKFPDIDIVLRPPRTILDNVKNRLKSLNIKDLSVTGNYNLHHKLKIKNGGLYGNINFLRAYMNISPYVTYSTMPQWRQTEAVLIADTLDLRNQTIEIDRTQVSEFWIIARKIIAADSAKITYSPTENPRKGARGRDGRNAMDYSSSCQSGHSARRGADGENGHEGNKGPDGVDASSINIFVLEIDSMPDIFAKGQRAGQGGRGGKGGNGGQGERGRSSNTKWYYGPFCDRRRGSGGHGGDGGDGGYGGLGGDGGDGADVTIATQESQLNKLVTNRAFSINIDGGMGGKSGIQGDAGTYGRGGRKGCDDDWICDDDAGSNGQHGQNGRRRGSRGEGRGGSSGMLNIATLTEDDWNLKLESPYISRLEHTRVYAGEQIIVHGMHFVQDRTYLYMDNHRIVAHYHPNNTMTFTVPETITFGRHTVYVKTSDGDKSNHVEFIVKPHILGVNIDNDGKMFISGRSFSPSITVFSNRQVLNISSSSSDRIEVEIPEVIGRYNGGRLRIQVANSDAYRSNFESFDTHPYMSNGFKANPNGWAFSNYSDGLGELGTFSDVFGADEVSLETLLHPVLTPLYYAFFRTFLRSNGHCTGMSLRSLEEYYKGNLDLFVDYPTLNTGIKRRLDIAQGKLLSHELLTHYGDQVDEGVERVEKSLREIESSLSRSTLSSNSARTLSFIPSGSFFDIDALTISHTVVPRKLVYAKDSRIIAGKRTLDGAKLYIYDNNHPNADDLFLSITEVDGVIHYSYSSDYSSQGSMPMTLGTGTLKEQLFDDVDLPLNIPFVVDILMSPAHLQIEDKEHNILGYKDGKIHTNRSMGYVSPWTDKLLLSKPDLDSNKRILGYDEGSYTFASKHPNGKTLVLKDLPCTAETEDLLSIAKEYAAISLTTKESKVVHISLVNQDFSSATTLYDGEMKEITLHYDAQANKKLDISFETDDLQLRSEENLSVVIESKRYNKLGKLIYHHTLESIALPHSQHLTISDDIWRDKNYIPLVQTP